ncbi:flavoprotein [Ktedonobacteria bacterium brp13]|nr:flavoprotein [Ktedonobacteria bacterium brp13]BCL83595.1 flavoprotein [Ktedonobacteria bacterium brp13]
MSAQRGKKVLYIIICASSSAPLAEKLIIQAKTNGWDVCILTTPQGYNFFDVPVFAQLTEYPIRSQYKHPTEPDVLPRADAIVVFPATFNTMNKWANGISDTLAVGILCEYMGLGYPIIAVPCFRTGGGLDGHPAFFRSIDFLRMCGVNVIYEPEMYPPKNQVPPDVILDALNGMMSSFTAEQAKSTKKLDKEIIRELEQ